MKIKKTSNPKNKPGRKCPACKKGKLKMKKGKYGKFLGCSRFPKCKYSTKVYGW